MRTQFQDELQPLNELLARQNATMQQLLLNLEERLRPLSEYADSEESNLESLERRMRESGSDFVTRSFPEYVQQQRKRIGETRQQIDSSARRSSSTAKTSVMPSRSRSHASTRTSKGCRATSSSSAR